MTALTEVERPLALFTQGLSNRVPIFRTDANEPAISSSDLSELFLPAEFTHFDKFEANREAFRWAVLQQLAFRRYDTLSFDIQLARAKFAFLAAHPLPTMHRLADLELFYKHFPLPDFASHLFYVLEESRVGDLIVKEFPGAARLRHRHRTYRQETASIPIDSPYRELVELELELNSRESTSPRLRGLTAPIHKPNATVYATVAATIQCYEAFCTGLSVKTLEMPPESMAEIPELPVLQRAARLEDWEQELRDMDAELLALSFDEGTDAAVVAQDESLDGSLREPTVEIKQERDQLQRRVDMERSLLSDYRAKRVVDSAHFRYDEWDYLNQSWLKAWCSVYELRHKHENQDSAAELLKRVHPLVPAVRKRFEQLKPAGMRRVPRSLDGDELDLNAIVEARADVKAGVTPSEHVYSRINKTLRDVSACLLVDLSASTDDPIKQPQANPMPEDAEDPFDDPYLHGGLDFDPEQRETDAPRKIIDVQKEAVLLLAAALEDLGDLYSVYGFSGYGRECVELHVVKEFNESLNRQTMSAIAAMKPLRSTRMGPAIRHATHKLVSTGSSLKVLLVISDGFPQDSDYGPDRGDHEYGIQDTAKALHEAADKGVQVFCVTIDVSGHDYLRRMCRADQYWIIEDTEELPNALQFAYRRLTS